MNKPLRIPIPKKIKEQIKSKYDGHCGYCGKKPDKLVIDHIHPVSREHFLKKAGKDVNHIDNLMPSCFSCNNYKFSWDLEEFREKLKWQVNMARQYSLHFRFAEKFGLIEVKEKPIIFYFEKSMERGPE